jgi:cytochrome P450
MTTGRTPPVRRLADGKYLVTGFAEALVVLSDERLSNDPANGADHPDITSQAAISQRRGTSMQLCDAPQHNRLRRAVAAALSQRSYAKQLDRMKQRAEDLFDAVLSRGEPAASHAAAKRGSIRLVIGQFSAIRLYSAGVAVIVGVWGRQPRHGEFHGRPT